MFRRPMRPLRRAVMRGVMRPNQVVMQAVARANNLLAQGKPNDAAQIFERLAQEGEARGFAKPAANAHAQTALAYAQAKNETAALTHARAALTQFAQLGMAQRAPTFYNDIVQKLRENGMMRAADALQREFGDQIKTLSAQGVGAAAPRGRLPSKCPHCAGPARSDEVEWIDAQSAECVYCGGVIQTE
ncbi:MAG: hypothetical protein AB1817_08605 [Chloroflexota bacterium]